MRVMIPIATAVIATTVPLAMSAIQIYVSAGRSYGAFIYGGQHRVLPLPRTEAL